MSVSGSERVKCISVDLKFCNINAGKFDQKQLHKINIDDIKLL